MKGGINIPKPKGGTKLSELRNTPELKAIWAECAASGFRGRCWGTKATSRFPASNIILADDQEIVIIWEEGGNGGLRVKGVSLDGVPGRPLYDEVSALVINFERGLLEPGSPDEG